MDVTKAILKIYPDWQGIVWENDPSKIVPHERETRPTPSLEELETAWAEVQKEEEEQARKEKANVLIQAKLEELAVAQLKAEGKLDTEGMIVE